MIEAFVWSAVIILWYMTVLFFVAVQKKDNSIVDIGWGIGFIIASLFTLFAYSDFTVRPLVITALVLIWGIRISGHILVRNWGKPEDHRYAAWRKEWKNYFYLRSYFQIFMLQGLVMWIILLPVIRVNSLANSAFGLLDLFGVTLWAIGFYFEVVGDYQLAQFIKDPSNKGKILKSGLWRYTRHPNYFGEALMWWGIYGIALSVSYGWLTIISPITITLLLRYVSGVPMAEHIFDNNPAYQAYKKETSPFIPWYVS